MTLFISNIVLDFFFSIQMKEPVFCHVNKDRLLGYLSACGGVTGISIGRKIKQMNLNLVQKALNSQKHGYEVLQTYILHDTLPHLYFYYPPS